MIFVLVCWKTYFFKLINIFDFFVFILVDAFGFPVFWFHKDREITKNHFTLVENNFGERKLSCSLWLPTRALVFLFFFLFCFVLFCLILFLFVLDSFFLFYFFYPKQFLGEHREDFLIISVSCMHYINKETE